MANTPKVHYLAISDNSCKGRIVFLESMEKDQGKHHRTVPIKPLEV